MRACRPRPQTPHCVSNTTTQRHHRRRRPHHSTPPPTYNRVSTLCPPSSRCPTGSTSTHLRPQTRRQTATCQVRCSSCKIALVLLFHSCCPLLLLLLPPLPPLLSSTPLLLLLLLSLSHTHSITHRHQWRVWKRLLCQQLGLELQRRQPSPSPTGRQVEQQIQGFAAVASFLFRLVIPPPLSSSTVMCVWCGAREREAERQLRWSARRQRPMSCPVCCVIALRLLMAVMTGSLGHLIQAVNRSLLRLNRV